MSFGQPVKKSNKTLWIILGVFGGVFLLVMGICCGCGLWFSSFPSVPNTALQPFDNSTFTAPTFPAAGVEVVSPLIPAGFVCKEIVLGDGSGYGMPPGANGRFYVYTPIEVDPDVTMPCVLVPPAGSTMMEGMELGEGDRAEHVPYLQAGFAVIAFSIDGPNQTGLPDARSYQQFRASHAGLANATNAVAYALTQMPMVNPKQVFIAGHSSAGTLAVLFAEHEPRLAGCVAFAPCIDVKARTPGFVVRMLGNSLDNLPEFIIQSSPRTHEQNLKCPTMVFHAADDSNVPIQDSRDFVNRMKTAGKDVTLVEVPSGDHYQPMIDDGIARGIEWMKQHLR